MADINMLSEGMSPPGNMYSLTKPGVRLNSSYFWSWTDMN